MLSHRLRRWPNIKPDLVQRRLFVGCVSLLFRSQSIRNSDPILAQFWTMVCDAGPTLSEHWFDVSCGGLSISQQTRNIKPMLFQCWYIVCDAGPTFSPHWVDISCGELCIPSKQETLNQSCFNVGPSTATLAQQWARVAHTWQTRNMRSWPNIQPDLHIPSKQETSNQCCFNVGPPSRTLAPVKPSRWIKA